MNRNCLMLCCLLSLGAANALAQNLTPGTGPGLDLFQEHCASCHDATAAAKLQAPNRAVISGMSARAIVAALESGKMSEQGKTLTAEQRRQIAEWWTGAPVVDLSFPDSAKCKFPPLEKQATLGTGWSGWGGNLESTGFRSTRQAGLAAKDIPSLELKWAFGIPGVIQVRSKPAIVDDLLILGSATGEVYGLDAKSGCMHWVFSADAAVRGGIVLVRTPAGRLLAYFADFRSNVYALDARNGGLIWRAAARDTLQSSTTGTLAYYDGRLYVPLSSQEGLIAREPDYECCVTSGGVVALNASNGEIAWRFRVVAEPARQTGENPHGARRFGPSGAPVWSSPTVDAKRGLLYIGSGENYSLPATDMSDSVIALELATGKVAWHFQGYANDTWNLACTLGPPDNCPEPTGPDFDFGMAPILVKTSYHNEILVAGQKSGMVYGLDPDQQGARLWAQRYGAGGINGGVHWGIATDGRLAFVPVADSSPPPIKPEPDFPRSPGVVGLDLRTGEAVWRQPAPTDTCGDRAGCGPGNSAAPTAIWGAVFAGSLDGHLRAYAAADGKLLWDFDTARDFKTVNGVKAHGGAIDGPGPVIAGGMVYTQSGYALFGQMPGNVFLAFGKPEH